MAGKQKPAYKHRPRAGQKIALKRLKNKPRVSQDRAGRWQVHAEAITSTLVEIGDDEKKVIDKS